MVSGTKNPHYYGRRLSGVSLLAVKLASLLRRPLQAISRTVPPPVLLLLVIQCVWLVFDQYVTSQLAFAPKRPYIPPTDASPLSPFYGPAYDDSYNNNGRPTPRVFPPRASFPCDSLRSEARFQSPSAALKSGFFFLMQVGCGSVTLAGVTSRIARNVAQREHAELMNGSNQTACAAWTAPVKAKRLKLRNLEKSFLWTFVREPVDRLVSKFFHHAAASLEDKSRITLDDFKSFLEQNVNLELGSYMKTMTMRRYINPQRVDLFKTYTSEILSAYDFIGVQERWDESLAVLQLLLGLETQDMLYLKTRSSDAPGGASFELLENRRPRLEKECVKLTKPAQITLQWKEYFHQPFMFEEVFEPDVYLYKAVNESLDATIDNLGRDKVEQAVKRLQWAQREVAEAQCAQSAVFPCSADGQLQLQATTDCFVSEVGCGSECLDSVGKGLSTNPSFLQLN
jgi:hypothetical protein